MVQAQSAQRNLKRLGGTKDISLWILNGVPTGWSRGKRGVGKEGGRVVV